MIKGARLLLASAGSVAVLSGSAWAKDLTFGYVPGSMIYPYSVTTAKGFEAEAKAVGVKTVVLDPRGSVEKQGNSIDDLIAQMVDAIGFLPLDSVVAQSFVNKVCDKTIPFVWRPALRSFGSRCSASFAACSPPITSSGATRAVSPG